MVGLYRWGGGEASSGQNIHYQSRDKGAGIPRVFVMCHFAKPGMTHKNLSEALQVYPQRVLFLIIRCQPGRNPCPGIKGAKKTHLTLDFIRQQVPVCLWGHRCLSFTLFLELSFPWNVLGGFQALWEWQTRILAHTSGCCEAKLFDGFKPGSLQPGDHPHSDCFLCRELGSCSGCGKLMCHQLVGIIQTADGAEKPEHPSWSISSTTVSHHRVIYRSLNGGNEPCCYPVVCKGDNC